MLYNQLVLNNPQYEWVVFIHGIGGSVATWKKQIDAFSKQYNLVLIDLPGHGQSQGKEKCFTDIEEVTGDIKDILDTNKIQRAHFVSLSLGTLVVAHYALSYPQTVASIIFGGAIIKLGTISGILMTLVQVIKRLLPFGLMYKALAFVLLPRKNHKKSRMVFIRESLKMQRSVFLKWMNMTKEGVHPDKLLQKLNALHINTLFIMGDEDKTFLCGAEKAVSLMDTARMNIIRHCGHVCSIEKYCEFNKLSLRFLNQMQLPTKMPLCAYVD